MPGSNFKLISSSRSDSIVTARQKETRDWHVEQDMFWQGASRLRRWSNSLLLCSIKLRVNLDILRDAVIEIWRGAPAMDHRAYFRSRSWRRACDEAQIRGEKWLSLKEGEEFSE